MRKFLFILSVMLAFPVCMNGRASGDVSLRSLLQEMVDRDPFREALVFDMELFHWADTRVNYTPVSYWYLKPGGRTAVAHDEIGARHPVKMK